MSYCRFHNTSIDLKDCLEAISNQTIESKSENLDAKKMFKTFLEFCERDGIIEGFDMEVVNLLIDGAMDTEMDDEVNEQLKK